MTWLNLLLGIVSIASGLMAYLQRRSVLKTAEAEVIKRNLEATINAIAEAKAVRKHVGAEFDESGGVPADRRDQRD